MAENTKDWDLYESGKKYNNSIKPNYYDTIASNRDFFSGNQWRNLEEDDELPKPVFNIIKRVITFFVASLTSAGQTVQFEPLEYNDDNPTEQVHVEKNTAEIATAEVANLFEKFKMDNRVRDASFYSAVDGDVAFHFYYDAEKIPYRGRFQNVQGEICMEVVRGESIMFGNANNPNKEEQPYIILVGRDMVSSLKEEAKMYKENQEQNIGEDSEYTNASDSANNIEVEADNYGKATYIIIYRRDKKTKRIKASKSVQNAYIYKDIDTGLDYYPISWFPWERQYNTYHGRAVCTGMIPNQIFINRMFAMVMYHLMMTAFPKVVYNSAYINGWTNQIGAAIAVDGHTMQPGESIRNIAGYLEPANMSNQIMDAIDRAYNYTKETLGINDAAIGNVDAKNVSGVAIQAVQRATSVPLENPKANLRECIEDVAMILMDMMGTYYGLRPIIREINGVRQAEMFDFSGLKQMWLTIKCDVGDASYWSEIAQVQTLDGMRQAGIIDAVQYLERIPERFVPRKAELIADLKQKMDVQAQIEQEKTMQAQGMQSEEPQPDPRMEQYEQMAQIIEQLPQEMRDEFMKLSPEEQEKAIQEFLAQQGGG